MATSRPFDARLTLLTDQDQPAGKWRTISLVTALREFLSRDPQGVIPSVEERCALLDGTHSTWPGRQLAGQVWPLR